MKKILSIVSILLILMAWFCAKPVFASPDEADGQEVLESENASDFYKIKEETLSKVDQYSEKYGGVTNECSRKYPLYA